MGGQRYTPAALAPGEGPGTHCSGDWVGPRAGLVGCSKFRHPTGESIPGLSSPWRVAIPTELSWRGGVGEFSLCSLILCVWFLRN